MSSLHAGSHLGNCFASLPTPLGSHPQATDRHDRAAESSKRATFSRIRPMTCLRGRILCRGSTLIFHFFSLKFFSFFFFVCRYSLSRRRERGFKRGMSRASTPSRCRAIAHRHVCKWILLFTRTPSKDASEKRAYLASCNVFSTLNTWPIRFAPPLQTRGSACGVCSLMSHHSLHTSHINNMSLTDQVVQGETGPTSKLSTRPRGSVDPHSTFRETVPLQGTQLEN